jgi:hypothetical protein
MIKKLAVPFINEKLLAQAEHCYIAVAAISDSGFEFVRSRIHPKCKMEIVTGLDELTSPRVLRKIQRHYQERISLRIYTKNFFHANVYILDLPYRKSVAFVGSGSFTLEGLKDQEELFLKITDPKEIENLKSWFTGYFEFAEYLNEGLVEAYDQVYHATRQREIESRKEKRDLIALHARGFNWDQIKFKNQFFKKEDYTTFERSKVSLINPIVAAEREAVMSKMNQLSELVQSHFLKLHLKHDTAHNISNADPMTRGDKKVTELGIAWRLLSDMKDLGGVATSRDFLAVLIAARQKEFALVLSFGNGGEGRSDRDTLQSKMTDAEFRKTFHTTLSNLGNDWIIEIAGNRNTAGGFINENALAEFVQQDDWRYYQFFIERIFEAGNPEIGIDNIASTIIKETERLIPLVKHVKSDR